MVKIAFFYIDPKEQIVRQSDARKNREVVNIMIESARKAMPGVEIFQLSDNDTPMIDGVDTLMGMGPTPEFMMPARIEYQTRFINGHRDVDANVIFVDPDILFQQDLEPVFDRDDWDVGLTWRDYSYYDVNWKAVSDKMPFNAGVVFSRVNDAAKQFWNTALERVNEMDAEHKKWYGDQLAILEGVNIEKYRSRTSDLIENDGVRFLMLPCTDFNYSPMVTEYNEAMSGGTSCSAFLDMKYAKVLHFKGQLKDGMNHYWNIVK